MYIRASTRVHVRKLFVHMHMFVRVFKYVACVFVITRSRNARVCEFLLSRSFVCTCARSFAGERAQEEAVSEEGQVGWRGDSFLSVTAPLFISRAKGGEFSPANQELSSA